MNISSVFQDKPNIGTDQNVSLTATYTLTAADIASAQQQLGRALSNAAPQVNLLQPGQEYGPRIRQVDFSAKKYFRFNNQRVMVGLDLYNLLNNNVTLAFNPTFVPQSNNGGNVWPGTSGYMNPRVFRLAAEYSW